MERLLCCMCNDSKLTTRHKIFNFTSSLIPTTEKYDENELCDLTFGSCDECGSLQLMTLIDPKKLYSENHNNTYFSNIWTNHHILFHNFITSRVNIKKIIEVGGCSLSLYKLFDNIIDYEILDFATPYESNNYDNITFIKGNCEDYNFDKDTPLIMSHVFEHLYNPRTFVENCNSENIFISIPQMNFSGSIEVHIEHTFYVEPIDLIKLFAKKGYDYEMMAYINHSYFFHFFKTYKQLEIPIIDKNRWIKVLESMKNREKIDIKENEYISPAGINGYYAYHFSGKPKIKAFMDNDPKKNNKRMYGTNINIIKTDLSIKDKIYFPYNIYSNEINKIN